MRCASAILLSLASILSPGGSLAQDRAALERLKKEAVPAWKNLEAFYDRFDAEIDEEIESRPTGQGATFRRENARVKRRGGNVLIETRVLEDPGDGFETVGCSADGHAFLLRRARSTDPWKVQLAGGESQRSTVGDHLDAWGEFFRASHSLFGKPLLELIDDPGFTLVDATEDPSGIVRINFRFEPSDPHAPRQEGWFELDSRHSWAVKGGDVKMWLTSAPNDASRVVSELTYDSSSHAFPVLRARRTESSAARGTQTLSHEVTAFDPREVPDSEFSPAAYGFDESAAPFVDAVASEPGRASTRRGWWLLGGAAALLALAGACRWRLRR